jgi:cell fate regulator YaaT (PSP1 superfamily)
MGCGNCGTANGKPAGCKSNGGCSSGGCNRLNVYDWLKGLPLSDSAKPYQVIEVSFNNGSRKDFYRNNTSHIFDKGACITVEGMGGFDVGTVSLTGELVKLQMKKYGVQDNHSLKRVLHPATEDELEQYRANKERESEILVRARSIARSLNLDMKLCEVEVQADGKKATFFYTAEQRVDFRELIKIYAGDFRVKVEMRQIGARQESGKVGGIGSCGRELCCSTWLTDFKSVNTSAARYQNLAINQVKLSGQCGRLKCCLNFELDTYMDALSVFPDNADTIETVAGIASLQKRDIFKNLMWYGYPQSNKQYPLTIARVKEIVKLNKQGQKVDELRHVEVETTVVKENAPVDMGFVNDVGQITLKAFEKKGKKRKSNKGKQQAAPEKEGQEKEAQQPNRQQQRQPGQQRQPNQQPRPQGQQSNRPQQQRPQGDKPQQGQRQGGQQQPRQQQGAGQPRPQQNQPKRQQPTQPPKENPEA